MDSRLPVLEIPVMANGTVTIAVDEDAGLISLFSELDPDDSDWSQALEIVKQVSDGTPPVEYLLDELDGGVLVFEFQIKPEPPGKGWRRGVQYSLAAAVLAIAGEVLANLPPGPLAP